MDSSAMLWNSFWVRVSSNHFHCHLENSNIPVWWNKGGPPDTFLYKGAPIIKRHCVVEIGNFFLFDKENKVEFKDDCFQFDGIFPGMHFSQAVATIQSLVGSVKGVQILYSDKVWFTWNHNWFHVKNLSTKFFHFSGSFDSGSCHQLNKRWHQTHFWSHKPKTENYWSTWVNFFEAQIWVRYIWLSVWFTQKPISRFF